MDTVAWVFHRYFQLKSRHTVTETILTSIEKAESDRCRKCTFHTRMDIHQALFNCRVCQRKWAEMLRKCEENADFRSSAVKQFLRLRKMTAAVLSFLTDT